MASLHVLVVSPGSPRREALVASLRAQGHLVAVADEARQGAGALAEPGFDLVLLDVRTPDLSLAAVRGALAPDDAPPPDSLEDAERRHIALVLRHTRGNKRQAAILLGISRSTLLHKLRKYQIVIPRT
jgi:DNA-binding NtrC family response regulator